MVKPLKQPVFQMTGECLRETEKCHAFDPEEIKEKKQEMFQIMKELYQRFGLDDYFK